jgi:hypothetical protein
MSTLLFPTEKLLEFEEQQMDLKISKPKGIRYMSMLKNYMQSN